MKFEPQYFPEECASRDETRAHLVNVHLDKAKSMLVATDGHMLVAVPCKVEAGDVDGAVPAAALREARSRAHRNRYGKKKGDDGLPRIRVGKRLLDTGGAIYRRPPATTFPPWEQVVPKTEPGDPGTVTFGINPKLLLALAKAVGAGTRSPLLQVTVVIPEAGKEMLDPILVRSAYGSANATAIVMPARVDVAHESRKKTEAA